MKKSTFYKNKRIYSTDDINVNNILVSKEESYGNKNSFKYFTGYSGNDIIRPLCIKLSQVTGYARKFISVFYSKIQTAFKNVTKIRKTIEGLMKINFEIKPVYGEDIKYMKTKIKTCRQHNHKFS